MFRSDKESLKGLLQEIEAGELQLPDFQRSWVWPVENITRLIASVSEGFPIGAIMTLVTGGAVTFAERPVEGVEADVNAQRLILDGQQRLTSLFQALRRDAPVITQDEKKRRRSGWFYIDMRDALDDKGSRDSAIRFIAADRKVRNFRGDVEQDLSTPEAEYDSLLFPLRLAFESDAWERSFYDHTKGTGHQAERMDLWMDFRSQVLSAFREYQVPLIELKANASREAVCQIFENVNTGAVPLNVFELLTAIYAAASFDLRSDWEAHQRSLRDPLVHRLLKEVSATDFLQAVTLVSTRANRLDAIASGVDPANAPRVGCRRIDILDLTLEDYRRHAPTVVEGLLTAARFLYGQKLFEARFLPYGSQIIPLAAILAALGDDTESAGAQTKISRWFWCGVFGELYGGSTETRFAADLPEVVAWVRGSAEVPRTITEAQFAASRLSTLRTRNSAAYKGLYALLLTAGARDWLTGKAVDVDTYFGESLDIHHIFPKRWCEEQGIDPKTYNGIANKTPLSSRTNRKIGGSAPSKYLPSLGDQDRVDATLRTHFVDPQLPRVDDFTAFLRAREETLLTAIEAATGKPCYRDAARAAEYVGEVDDTEDE
ncbi:GmrSD restriction endonuclease domain-containing protein [Glycomyces buryatensis]|uniref:DUF262 domain-containing protein n=1 Tax=Glycomyces buryatensis TaxID=2570927 RepID=A0A4S8QFT3_9ACTN|nr:DUF262 domain-containing protein [Glycomyces buryatensis]THV41795.1 DUF262 domain-containing protein [Glycomyces buryatensis]